MKIIELVTLDRLFILYKLYKYSFNKFKKNNIVVIWITIELLLKCLNVIRFLLEQNKLLKVI